MTEMAEAALDRVRQIVLGLPGVLERLSHGAPCFFVQNKRPICYYHDQEFSGDDRDVIWCPAAPGVPDEMVAAEPDRFFRPQPSASGVFSTWLGVYLDTTKTAEPEQWNEIVALLEDAYRTVAPATLIVELDRRHRQASRDCGDA